MEVALRTALAGIADAVGESGHGVETEHDRWALYERAIRSSVGLDLLREAVALEEDRALAVTVVLRMLEQAPESEHAAWIGLLPVDNRSFSERRAAEIRILRRAKEDVLPATEIASTLGEWTDWLQLRLAELLVDRDGLEALSIDGRTRRIRNVASTRLRSLAA
ncbi:hypothetical protein [Micromonospora coxensis]|uniref:hypothetical protein n=1 Tax=Micromonospora coxensis TaxID=356852 RepID=UPI003433F062